jgi:hypothetical protein
MPPRSNRPAWVELRLRKEAGFGCCKCGRPIYQYHHIEEYAGDQHYRPEDMMLLCPNCHDEATKGAITKKEQRELKANPFNIQRGYVNGPLKVNQDKCIVDVGSLTLIADGDLVRVDAEPLLRLRREEQGSLLVSLSLFDRDDRLLVQIIDNEWISDSDSQPWDIESDIQYLRIRQKRGDIRLEIDASKVPIKIRANLWRRGQNIELGPKAVILTKQFIEFQNLILDGFCFNFDSHANKFNLAPSVLPPPPMVTLLKHTDTVFEDGLFRRICGSFLRWSAGQRLRFLRHGSGVQWQGRKKVALAA